MQIREFEVEVTGPAVAKIKQRAKAVLKVTQKIPASSKIVESGIKLFNLLDNI